MSNEWDWLHALFGSYDLYYLDPLIVKDAMPAKDAQGKPTASQRGRATTRLTWLTQWGKKSAAPPWFTQDRKVAKELLTQIRKTIGIDAPGKDQDAFFENSVQLQLIDRGNQTEISKAIIKTLSEDSASSQVLRQERQIGSAAGLRQSASQLQDMPNRSTADCLVVVDGMISNLDTSSNPSLYNLVAVTPRTEDRRLRMTRFCIADRPARLLGFEDPCFGLMVDQRGLLKTYPSEAPNDGAIDLVSSNGWYPFAKVLGFWRADRGGRRYLDVVAILIKTFPSLDQILRLKTNNGKRKLVEMLENGIAAVEQHVDLHAKTPDSRYNGANDYPLVYPLLLTALCWSINGVDLNAISTRARGLANLFKQYQSAIVKLADVVKLQPVDSLLPAFVDSLPLSASGLLRSGQPMLEG